jgi:hypothetical protein
MKFITYLALTLGSFVALEIGLPKLEARAYNPVIEAWRDIKSGYDLLLNDDVKSSLDVLTATMTRACEFDEEQSLSMIGASCFGIFVCCERLGRMDDVYKEIGKQVANLFLLDDVFSDFVEDLDDPSDTFRIEITSILDRLGLSKNDLYQLEVKTKDVNLKQILSALMEIV